MTLGKEEERKKGRKKNKGGGREKRDRGEEWQAHAWGAVRREREMEEREEEE